MRPTGCLFLLLVAACHGAGPRIGSRPPAVADSSTVLVIRGPTVVVFNLHAADTLEGEAAQDAEDFKAYVRLVEPELSHHGVTVVATARDTIRVETPTGIIRTVMLGGLDFPYGVVLVDPGYPEQIMTGLSTDDQVINAADDYFQWDEEEPTDSTLRTTALTLRANQR
jgi:hypothetical protein